MENTPGSDNFDSILNNSEISNFHMDYETNERDLDKIISNANNIIDKKAYKFECE